MADDIKQTAKELTVALIPLCCKVNVNEDTMNEFIQKAIYLYKTIQEELKPKSQGEMGVTTFTR